MAERKRNPKKKSSRYSYKRKRKKGGALRRLFWGIAALFSAFITLGEVLNIPQLPNWDDVFIAADRIFFGAAEGMVLPEEGQAVVTVLDMGQADSILIQTPDSSILIDGGLQETQDNLVASLKYRGVKHLDLVVATHPHSDHIGGLARVLERFTVGELLVSPASSDTSLYENLLLTA